MVMEVLNIAGREVKADVDKMAKGLCDLHNSDETSKTILSFGMLDAKLCELFETNLKECIQNQFSEEVNTLFGDRINEFVRKVNNKVQKGVYKYANMVV